MDTDRKATVVAMPFMNAKKSQAIPVRESLFWFSGKMEEDLQVFDRSISAWETEVALAILDDLDEQVIELRSKFLMAMRNTQPKIQNAVINQCVQVANLAHMIASCHHPMLSRCRNGKSSDSQLRIALNATEGTGIRYGRDNGPFHDSCCQKAHNAQVRIDNAG